MAQCGHRAVLIVTITPIGTTTNIARRRVDLRCGLAMDHEGAHVDAVAGENWEGPAAARRPYCATRRRRLKHAGGSDRGNNRRAAESARVSPRDRFQSAPSHLRCRLEVGVGATTPAVATSGVSGRVAPNAEGGVLGLGRPFDGEGAKIKVLPLPTTLSPRCCRRAR